MGHAMGEGWRLQALVEQCETVRAPNKTPHLRYNYQSGSQYQGNNSCSSLEPNESPEQTGIVTSYRTLKSDGHTVAIVYEEFKISAVLQFFTLKKFT